MAGGSDGGKRGKGEMHGRRGQYAGGCFGGGGGFGGEAGFGGYSRSAATYMLLMRLLELSRDGGNGRALAGAFSERGEGSEKISAVRQRCRVDTDWIEKIEDGAVHLRKAIEQSRSLIKKEGEVVRIDRAKRFSKESVEHLARRSNVIKEISDDRVIPEEIYVTENDDEYAVYENRFLYMVLTFAKNFTALRNSEIKKASKGSGIRISIGRSGGNENENAEYELEISERSRSGSEARTAEINSILKRIGELEGELEALAATPLMRRVSAAPPLRPPVVRTNIIKSNVEFAAVFELYSYLTNYVGPGFETEREESGEIRPDREEMEIFRALAEAQLFAAYQSAFGSWDERKEEYETEKAAAEREKADFYAGELRRIRERFSGDAREPAGGEYERKLEEAYIALSRMLEETASERDALLAGKRAAEAEAAAAAEENERLSSEARQAHETAVRKITETEARLRKENECRLGAEREEHRREMDELRKRTDEAMTLLAGRLRAAGLLGAASEAADACADITDRDSFVGLEREKKAFDEYFKRQWALNRRRIRREVREKYRRHGDGTSSSGGASGSDGASGSGCAEGNG